MWYAEAPHLDLSFGEHVHGIGGRYVYGDRGKPDTVVQHAEHAVLSEQALDKVIQARPPRTMNIETRPNAFRFMRVARERGGGSEPSPLRLTA